MSITTYTNCLRIERTDGIVLCITELDEDLIIDDSVLGFPSAEQTYISAAGYTPTNYQSTSDNAVNNADVEGVLTEVGVNRIDIIGGRYDFAKLHIFIWDFENDTLIKKLGSGHWGEVTLKDGSYVAEFRSLSQQLQQTIGRTFNPECDEQLGGYRCTIDVNLYKETGTITNVIDNATFESTISGTNADSIYSYGKLTFTGTTTEEFNGSVTTVLSATEFMDTSVEGIPDGSVNGRSITFTTGPNTDESVIIVSQLSTGYVQVAATLPELITLYDNYTLNILNANTGLHMEVKGNELANNKFSLFLPMPFGVEVGDTFTVYQGCDKKLLTCKDKFVNHENFQGFPYIPGQDAITKFGGQ